MTGAGVILVCILRQKKTFWGWQVNNQITLDLDIAEHIAGLLGVMIEELKEELLEVSYSQDELRQGIDAMFSICGIVNVLNKQIEGKFK